VRGKGICCGCEEERASFIGLFLLLLFGERVDTVDLDNWRTLGQIGSDNDLRYISKIHKARASPGTYRNSH